jgi:uncharacterized protein YhfF
MPDVTIPDFWAAYCVKNGITGPMPEVTSFGDGPTQQDELCALVVAGPKRATAALALWYERESVPKPVAGGLSIALDGGGVPRAVLQTTGVHEARFCDVDAAFAADEGEGDGSLDYWRAAHEAFFTRELAEVGLVFSPTMVVVCERFQLLWDGRA